MTAMDSSAQPAPDARRRHRDDVAAGDRARVQRVLTAESLQLFARLATSPESSGPDDHALASAQDKASVAISTWLNALIALALGTCLAGTDLVRRRQQMRFVTAVRVGDTIHAEVIVTERQPDSDRITLHCVCTNQDGACVADGQIVVAPSDTNDSHLDETGIHIGEGDASRRLLAHVRALEAVRVAVAHPCDEASLTAALEACRAGLIRPVLVAPRARLEAVAAQCGADLSGMDIIDVPHSHAAAQTAVELAANGDVEAVMKGSLHTDELMAAVVAPANRLRTKRRISHCFVLQTPGYPRPFIVTDAAINLAPNLEQKADIVRNAIDLAQVMGVSCPKVAILAAVETVSPLMPATLDAAALCKMADRGQITGGQLDGPLAFDNAISIMAARTKGIVSPVAGQADILLVPDLESGNMLAKQLIYLGQAASAGIVMGARVPIILTSRADNRQARIASCALALMLAHHYRQSPP